MPASAPPDDAAACPAPGLQTCVVTVAWDRRRALAVLAGLCAASVPVVTWAADQENRFLRIGTGNVNGTYYQIGGLLADIVSNPPGSRPCDRGGSCGVPGLIAIAQSSSGSVANVEAIAQSSKRVEAMSFGVADYAASTRARTMGIGAPHPDYGILSDKDGDKPREFYWNDPWHYALSRMMVACRAYGLRPIDGPFGDFSDPDGYTAAAKRAAVLGFEGKWAIHPSQVELANKVFTPSEAEVTKAKRIVEAMKQAAKEGKGAVSLDGRLIDIASIRMAEALIEKANAMSAS